MLNPIACLDSDELAHRWRECLDLPRWQAREYGESAVEAARCGVYLGPDGGKVPWADEVAAAVAAKDSIAPDSALPEFSREVFPVTRVQVANETTLCAARRMIDAGHRPLALNFANGVSPGGGFLHGARAQEEALCRSSALHATLEGDPMYEAHRRRPRPDSTAWAILSPDVPVFRDDGGAPLSEPYGVSFLTCAAPVASRIGQPESGDLLQARIHRILAIARAYGYATLVLGAWGCGAFGNDPVRTAQDFRRALEGEFDGAFEEVAFAVTDWSSERRFLGPFRDAFVRPGQRGQ